MAEVAPAALKWLGSRVAPDLGGVLSGIVGDKAHTRGYHRGRNYVRSTDYSVQLAEDKRGDGDHASGIDMSFSPAKMKLYTSRLKAAADRNDPRLKYVREFYGTLNGTTVYGRTHRGSGDGTWELSSSDLSHLWHVHMSILRQYANNQAVMQGILDVLMGKPLVAPEEEFVMATKAEVMDAIREVLREDVAFQASGPASRLTASGWKPVSILERLDYIFESTRVKGSTDIASAVAVLVNELRSENQAAAAAVLAAIANVDEEVLNKIRSEASPEATAALLKAALGDRADEVFRAGLGLTA